MKPATAAKKLGVYLPATPEEFQQGLVSRDRLNELQANPPEWLVDLRRNGPHPRPEVAARLSVSIAGLARGGVTEPLTTAQIAEMLDNPPEWLFQERAILAEVRREERRLKARDAERARSGSTPAQD